MNKENLLHLLQTLKDSRKMIHDFYPWVDKTRYKAVMKSLDEDIKRGENKLNSIYCSRQ